MDEPRKANEEKEKKKKKKSKKRKRERSEAKEEIADEALLSKAESLEEKDDEGPVCEGKADDSNEGAPAAGPDEDDEEPALSKKAMRRLLTGVNRRSGGRKHKKSGTVKRTDPFVVT